MAAHINTDNAFIDEWLRQAKDTTLDGPHREHAFICIRRYFPDYMSFAQFIQHGNTYTIEIEKGYPGIDSLVQMQKDYTKSQWYQKTNEMLFRQSKMIVAEK